MELDPGQTLVTSVSVGMAIYPHDAADEVALLRHADAAMYARKASRREAPDATPDAEAQAQAAV
jgi:diguanylate cyclase